MNKPMRYRIRRLEVLAGARFGCAAGALLALPGGLLTGGLLCLIVSGVRRLLEGWQHVPLDMGVLGQFSLDVVTLLHLNEWLAGARFFDQSPGLVIGGVLLAAMLFLGSLGSFLGVAGALLYNSIAAFSGGLMVDVESVE